MKGFSGGCFLVKVSGVYQWASALAFYREQAPRNPMKYSDATSCQVMCNAHVTMGSSCISCQLHNLSVF
jgi:hypothetical protein